MEIVQRAVKSGGVVFCVTSECRVDGAVACPHHHGYMLWSRLEAGMVCIICSQRHVMRFRRSAHEVKKHLLFKFAYCDCDIMCREVVI